MVYEAVKTILFLCTGNYYRSRFAEELFNHRAAHLGINWQAQSRALAIERGRNNVGSLSPLVLWGLMTRGLSAKGTNRAPQQCTILDLESADFIVALNEIEHRLLMSERFPDWSSRTQYWEIGDVEDTAAAPGARIHRFTNGCSASCFSRVSRSRIGATRVPLLTRQKGPQLRCECWLAFSKRVRCAVTGTAETHHART